jgi:hypothetical protein
MNLTQHQLAYIAGFLEGDGSFQIMKYKSKTCGIVYEYRISGYNTKEEVIKWLVDNIGGYYAKVATSPRQKEPYHWNIKNQEAIKLAEQIYPYIIAKQDELNIWLQYAHDIISNRTNKRTQESIDFREDCIKQIRNIRFNKNLVTQNDCLRYKTIKPIVKPNQLDIAYLAGLIDAEGCFRLHRLIKKNRPNPTWASMLEIGNTNTLFFPYLMSKFGGNIYYVKSKEPKQRSYGIWYIMATQLQVFINDLVKYLIIKKPVCEKIIEFSNTIIPNGGDRHSVKFIDSFKEVLATRERIFAEIQTLNTKGHNKSSL